MINLERLRTLHPRQRALVVVALLLDGREAANYLEQDAHYGRDLADIAKMMGEVDPEIRMPLLGTILRESIKELSEAEST